MKIGTPQNLVPTIQFQATAGGKAVPIDGQATVTMDDPNVVVTPKSDDGLTVEVDAGPDATVGTILTGKISGDARLGDGTRTIETAFELEILEMEAEGFQPLVTGFRTRG